MATLTDNSSEMNNNILIVEDDMAIREMMAFSLRREGFATFKAASGHEALEQLNQVNPDLIVIDWGLPDMSGIELIDMIRRDDVIKDVPIIMLTARAEEADKVKGLERGADDYLTKPASMLELMARIRAHLRRSKGFELIQSLEFQGIVMNSDAHEVKIDGVAINLSLTEFKLLKLFLQNPNKLLAREHILNHIWGRNTFVEDRTVDVHVLRLRKALKTHNKDQWIQTVRGVGYKLAS
ncbi:response regulator [Marinicella litoralis]|uniref:Phosphate regulon transcriptional regulatory protein PhoB n=2 Tax=Marinicella litoralis TaxID=644220 RepID=A0A4R6XEZ4_9GAMM|nr:response regulator [Marinicella litoralis]TDR16799.1 winged helix family two component transcriptional regulator [Marinicella litoralis]